MIPTDDILEGLDLSRAQPGSGFLEALFERFNARVPFENASKILRDADEADFDRKPRTPEIFWNDHLESGTGGTCFARVAAFDALLRALSFRTRSLLGRVGRDNDHAALLVETPTGEWIADVGFPLPALLPPRPGRLSTALGDLETEPTARGFEVSWSEGVPDGPRSIEIFMQPVDAETFAGLWRQTFSPGAHFLKAVSMRVDRPGRVVSFAGGEVRIDDRHSRLRVPIGSAEGALEELFGIDRGLLARAFGIAGRPEPEARETTLTAYLEAAAGPDEAFRTVATRQGYRRLIGGVADVVGEEATTEGFRLTLAPPGTADGDDGDGGRLVEDVAVVPGSRRVRIERQIGAAGAVSRSAYAVEIRAGRTYLVREAVLPGVREDLLRNDSLRGRLAGSLAVDLLAWARRIRDADAGEEAARNP